MLFMILDIYKDSLEYGLQDLKSLLLLGVCYLFSIFLIPIFLVYGYLFKVLKVAVKGQINGNDELPIFEGFSSMFVDGIKVFCVQILYYIIPFVFALLALISLNYFNNMTISILLGIIFLILIFCAFIFSNLGLAHMAQKRESFYDAFEVKELYQILKSIGILKIIGFYLGLFVIIFVIALIVFLIIALILGIGLSISMLSSPLLGFGIISSGFVIAFLIFLFIIGPYLSIFQYRSIGLIYNLRE